MGQSNGGPDPRQLFKQSRLTIGSLLRADEEWRREIIDRVAARLASSLNTGSDNLTLALDTSTNLCRFSMEQAENDSAEYLVIEFTLVCFEMMAALPKASPPAREDLRGQLDAIERLISRSATSRQLIALRAVNAWPYSWQSQDGEAV